MGLLTVIILGTLSGLPPDFLSFGGEEEPSVASKRRLDKNSPGFSGSDMANRGWRPTKYAKYSKLS